MNGLKHLKKHKKFIYLISPNKVKGNNFYINLEKIFKTNKIAFFQLRLKKEKIENLIKIGKKIKKICKKYQVKFLINDDPVIAKKINADGCHLGQNDMNIKEARKILRKKIIGITCHNSKKFIRQAVKHGANYIAFKADYNSIQTNGEIIDLFQWWAEFIEIPIMGECSDNCLISKSIWDYCDFFSLEDKIWKRKISIESLFKPFDTN